MELILFWVICLNQRIHKGIRYSRDLKQTQSSRAIYTLFLYFLLNILIKYSININKIYFCSTFCVDSMTLMILTFERCFQILGMLLMPFPTNCFLIFFPPNPRLLPRNTATLTFQQNSQESGAISTMPMPVKNLLIHVLKTKKLKLPMQVQLNRRVRTTLSAEKALFTCYIRKAFGKKTMENTISSI